MKRLKVVIMGSGRLGFPTGKVLAQWHEVIFCDIQESVLEKIRGMGFVACTPAYLKKIANIDVIMLCVRTDFSEKKGYDLTQVKKALKNMAPLFKTKHPPVLINRCTVLPFTLEKEIIKLLKKYSGKNREYVLAANPEFLREGDAAINDFLRQSPVVIGLFENGGDKKARKILSTLYEPLNAPLIELAPNEAEAVKMSVNFINACKIALSNQLRRLWVKARVKSPQKVVKTAWLISLAQNSRAYGIEDKGLIGADGKMCQPKDTRALRFLARKLKVPQPILDGVITETVL